MDVLKKKFDTNLEVIRGFAAIIVIFHHVIFHNKYFNTNFFPSTLKSFEPPGHFAVLIFFVLSGYVIGSVHKQRIVGKEIWLYLKKRFVRIYPIYFVAIIAGLIVGVHYNVSTIFANLTLTQNILFPVIWENNPAWSLNYECLFYLLFIPISYFNIKPLYAFIIFFSIGTLNLYTHTSALLTAYSYGFCFWLVGLWLAQAFKDGEKRHINFPSVFFYVLGLESLIGKDSYLSVSLLISKFKSPLVKTGLWSQFAITANDLLFLPYCLMLIVIVSGKEFKYRNWIFSLLQIFPVYVIYSTIKHNKNPSLEFRVATIYMLIALAFLLIKVNSEKINKVGTWFGSISYGLYIIHFPILYFFGLYTFAADTVPLYILKISLFCGVTLAFALILEKIYQPAIRNILMKPRL